MTKGRVALTLAAVTGMDSAADYPQDATALRIFQPLANFPWKHDPTLVIPSEAEGSAVPPHPADNQNPRTGCGS
jgi:hypothetical protein